MAEKVKCWNCAEGKRWKESWYVGRYALGTQYWVKCENKDSANYGTTTGPPSDTCPHAKEKKWLRK